MRKYSVRFVVAILTLTIGATSSYVGNFYRSSRLHVVTDDLQAPVQMSPQTSEPIQSREPLMPKSLSPFDIEFFINENPQADLSRLWQVLGISTGSERGESRGLRKCEGCSAEIFAYDFDGQVGDEILLRVADPIVESFRYLVFKFTENLWKVLGYIDAWGKYKEPSHMVLLSGGQSWLIIRDQGARGSGVASYIDRVFRIEPTRLIEGVSYIAEGHQYGISYEPNRDFSTHILACKLLNDVVVAQIEYDVEYVTEDERNPTKWVTLFSRTQKVTIAKARYGTQRFDRQRSDLSEGEFDSVYNIDTLTKEDFLKYNYDQLAQIAGGRNLSKKEWLRQFLRTSENTIDRRTLNQLLAR